MIVFPAIDIKNGRCVRLRQGEASDVTVYGEDPVETALSFEEAGAEFLHVVDLDGAFEGKGVNTPLIRSICEAVSIPVETGGGIRTMDDIEERIDAGVFRVIIGSRAVEDPSFAAKAAARWKDRIAVSIDARGDEAAVHGWTKSGGVKVMPLAKELLSSGVSTISAPRRPDNSRSSSGAADSTASRPGTVFWLSRAARPAARGTSWNKSATASHRRVTVCAAGPARR